MVRLIRRGLASTLAAAAVVASGPCFAWDGVVSGTVSEVDVTAGNNFALRVFLSGVSGPLCTGSTSSFGYLNNTDSNYSTYVAAVMMAKATGARVAMYLTLVSGQCQIGYLAVS